MSIAIAQNGIRIHFGLFGMVQVVFCHVKLLPDPVPCGSPLVGSPFPSFICSDCAFAHFRLLLQTFRILPFQSQVTLRPIEK
jgi:hypothetical protein